MSAITSSRPRSLGSAIVKGSAAFFNALSALSVQALHCQGHATDLCATNAQKIARCAVPDLSTIATRRAGALEIRVW